MKRIQRDSRQVQDGTTSAATVNSTGSRHVGSPQCYPTLMVEALKADDTKYRVPPSSVVMWRTLQLATTIES